MKIKIEPVGYPDISYPPKVLVRERASGRAAELEREFIEDDEDSDDKPASEEVISVLGYDPDKGE